MATVSHDIQPGAIPLRDAYIRLGGKGDPRHAYAMVREHRWPTVTIRLGSRILVPIDALEAYLSRGSDVSRPDANRAA